jgi:hypothetical protein
MKKLLTLILTVSLLFTIASCAPTPTTPSTSTEDPAPKEDLFLIGISESGSGLVGQSSTFQSANSHGIGGSLRTVLIDSLKNQTKDPFSDGTPFTYKRSEVKYKSASSTEIGSFYSQYDVYSTDTKYVEYLADSNLIVYYDDINYPANGQQQCSEEELLQKAKDFLQKCIPASELAKYTYSGKPSDAAGMTGLKFTRYIDGYQTDDVLLVFFSDNGTIMGYNGLEACKFNSVSTKITKEKLDTATAKLMEKIEALELANLTHGDPVLTTNTSGEVFIEIWIRYTDAQNTNQDSYLDLLYVRVN